MGASKVNTVEIAHEQDLRVTLTTVTGRERSLGRPTLTTTM